MSFTNKQLKKIIKEEYINLVKEEQAGSGFFSNLLDIGGSIKDFFTGTTTSGTDIGKGAGRRFARYKFVPKDEEVPEDEEEFDQTQTSSTEPSAAGHVQDTGDQESAYQMVDAPPEETIPGGEFNFPEDDSDTSSDVKSADVNPNQKEIDILNYELKNIKGSGKPQDKKRKELKQKIFKLGGKPITPKKEEIELQEDNQELSYNKIYENWKIFIKVKS